MVYKTFIIFQVYHSKWCKAVITFAWIPLSGSYVLPLYVMLQVFACVNAVGLVHYFFQQIAQFNPSRSTLHVPVYPTRPGLPYTSRSTLHASVYPTRPGLPYTPRSTLHVPVYPTRPGLPYTPRSTLHVPVYPTRPGLPYTPRSTLHVPVYPTRPGLPYTPRSTLHARRLAIKT